MVLMVLACAGQGVEEVTSTALCTRFDSAGSYRVTYQERSGGTCGPLTPAVLDFSQIPVECTQAQADSWSQDDCTLERRLNCTAGIYQVNGVMEITSDRDAKQLTGTYAAEIVGLCTSEYDLVGVPE